MYRFPNLYPGTRTVIVLKQPKTEGSIRNVYIPETVLQLEYPTYRLGVRPRWIKQILESNYYSF